MFLYFFVTTKYSEMKRTIILINFINNFDSLRDEALSSDSAPLVEEYIKRVYRLAKGVRNLFNENSETTVEEDLLSIAQAAIAYRNDYPSRTFAHMVFNSIYDLAIETLTELKNC